ncbi:hypothetical protein JTE90_006090 [Oedothorax gibbosus]|uniref:Mediator of RNA polymerase II transcription subunit 29 n=1 Tax=Oedothorax gibbosus TaxID=931172 RepID=A0AAV6V4B1_9ARAC|nr:hypothetical protein JTE90_006090 [Oedothorax gibbosus]
MMSAPGMVPGGVPMQHPGMPPQPPPPSQQSHLQQQIELKYDNVNKVKTLIWSLKDSFANVMKVAGARVNHLLIPGKTPEDTPPRYDKTLEDFFSICNQIELHLKAIQECTLQNKDSQHYVPLHVTLGKQDASSGPSQDGNLSYTQYISTVKGQVHFAKSVQDILTEGVSAKSSS